jgi:hypothetical protein
MSDRSLGVSLAFRASPPARLTLFLVASSSLSIYRYLSHLPIRNTLTTTASSTTILLSLQSGRQKESSPVLVKVARVVNHTLNTVLWLNVLFILATLLLALLF